MTNEVKATTKKKPILGVVSEDYNLLNAIAHGKWAPKFGAPTLTWHRAFWVQDIYEQSEKQIARHLKTNPPSRTELTPRTWLKQRLDEAILVFAEGLRNQKIDIEFHPNIPHKNEHNVFLFSKVVSYDDLTKEKPIHRLTPREKDTFDGDHRIVTLEFDMHGISMVVRVELRGEYFCITTFANFSDDIGHKHYYNNVDFGPFREKYEALKVKLESGDPAALSYELSRYFYIGFWEDFWVYVYGKTARPKIFNARIFKNMFADFRGVMISNTSCCNRLNCRRDIESGAWGYRIDSMLRKLLHNSNKYEVTASYALRNRLIYMSTLGVQPPETSPEEVVPLEYVVYAQQGNPLRVVQSQTVRGISEWQLGRFIDRLHLLGTVHLAALKYYPALMRVASQLSRLEPIVAAARRTITNPRRNADKEIRAAHGAFGQITDKFNKDTQTRSGILHRVERSRYYVAQFNKNIPGLDLQIIDGYPRYDSFIERRIAPSFDFIDRVGRRYERAETSLSALDQYNLTIQARDLARHISEVSEVIAETGKSANSINDRVLDIQRYGEVILFFFPLPYYASSMVEHTLDAGAAEILAIPIWILSVGHAFNKLYETRKELSESRKVHTAKERKPEKPRKRYRDAAVALIRKYLPARYDYIAAMIAMTVFAIIFAMNDKLKFKFQSHLEHEIKHDSREEIKFGELERSVSKLDGRVAEVAAQQNELRDIEANVSSDVDMLKKQSPLTKVYFPITTTLFDFNQKTSSAPKQDERQLKGGNRLRKKGR